MIYFQSEGFNKWDFYFEPGLKILVVVLSKEGFAGTSPAKPSFCMTLDFVITHTKFVVDALHTFTAIPLTAISLIRLTPNCYTTLQ